MRYTERRDPAEMPNAPCDNNWGATAREDNMLRYVALVASALALLLSPQALAQNWPQRPVTFIVSQSAGASPDVMARMITTKLGAALGQSFVVENKPGAGNVIGAQAAARAAPDGYTFFFATSAALVTNPYMLKNLSYDPVKDFAPVALVTRSHQIVVVNPDVPAKTLPELIALDKAAPGKIAMAVDGPRNLAGVTAQALNKRAGTNFVLIPSVNINAGLQDTIAGRTQAGVFSASILESHLRSGALRALATASNARLSAAPDIPTAAETLPGFDFSGWFMLMAPAGTPPDIIKKLNAALDDVLRDPQVRDLAPKLGFELDPKGVGSPEQAAEFLKAQLALWAKTTQELGIVAQ
jgi:tripartite-type tricarboxylate transporter receptor subunit TctC